MRTEAGVSPVIIDKEYQVIFDRLDRILKTVITAVWGQKPPPVEHRVLSKFVIYVAGNTRVIYRVLSNGESNEEVEAMGNATCALLRCIWDAVIQAEYICHDPSMLESRARQFEAFRIVEQVSADEALQKHSNLFSQRLLSSQTRLTNKAAIDAEYLRVKSQYETQDGRMQTKWYKGNLKIWATLVGAADEYLFFASISSSSVHAGPMALTTGPIFQGSALFYFVLNLTARCLKLLVKYGPACLSNEDIKFINRLGKRFGDSPT